ncbi:MAG: hypothetical protein JWR80_1508 [Bradyrhizobium sp.]|nr:hypothetical protein [Bradyrhizobium sp.]
MMPVTFSLVVAAIFHHDFASPIQLVMALKDVGIGGALILISLESGLSTTKSRTRVDRSDLRLPILYQWLPSLSKPGFHVD